MKTVRLNSVIILGLLFINSLLLTGCTTYSGLWDRFWERFGFNQPRMEERQERPEWSGRPGNTEKEENLGDHGELVEEAQRTLNELEEKVFTQINDYRISKGLNTLASDERLVEQARIHSRNMGRGTVAFGHQGFQERIKAAAIPYKSAAENVAYTNQSDPASAAVEAGSPVRGTGGILKAALT
ncbi:MAG TPA: hypothetical protein GXZ36_07220 [Firmicutes bacterium]|nr:hypothetical protein [Bacillota bacterium]